MPQLTRIPRRNGVGTILGVCRIIVRMAALFAPIWPQIMSAEDAEDLLDLVNCAQIVLDRVDKPDAGGELPT